MNTFRALQKPLIHARLVSSMGNRHLRADGRTSVAAAFSNRSALPERASLWAKTRQDWSTWPLLGCMGAAVVLVTTFGFRHLSSSPDVHVTTSRRGSFVRDTTAEGEKWVNFRNSWRGEKPVSEIGLWR